MNTNPCDTCSLCVSLTRENGDFPYNQCMAHLRIVTRNNIVMDNGGDNYSSCALKVDGKPYSGYAERSVSRNPEEYEQIVRDTIFLNGESTDPVVAILSWVFVNQEITGINLDATVNHCVRKIMDSDIPDEEKSVWKTKFYSYLKDEKKRIMDEAVLHNVSDSPMAVAMRDAMKK